MHIAVRQGGKGNHRPFWLKPVIFFPGPTSLPASVCYTRGLSTSVFVPFTSLALQRRGLLEVASLSISISSQPAVCSMAAADPSRLELDAMRIVGDAMDWVPIPDPLRTVVLTGFGLADAEPIRALAAIAEQDVLDARTSMRLGEAPLNPRRQGQGGDGLAGCPDCRQAGANAEPDDGRG